MWTNKNCHKNRIPHESRNFVCTEGPQTLFKVLELPLLPIFNYFRDYCYAAVEVTGSGGGDGLYKHFGLFSPCTFFKFSSQKSVQKIFSLKWSKIIFPRPIFNWLLIFCYFYLFLNRKGSEGFVCSFEVLFKIDIFTTLLIIL